MYSFPKFVIFKVFALISQQIFNFSVRSWTSKYYYFVKLLEFSQELITYINYNKPFTFLIKILDCKFRQ